MQPLYLKVKQHIRANIDSGRWAAAARVPSENQIVREFGVSRMTANRALRELSDEGVLVRVAGVGSFVAHRQPTSHPLEVRDIAQEIRARGHVHHAEVLALERVRADATIAGEFALAPGSELFYSAIVHHENGLPILLEDRYVLPRIAPDYLQLDLRRTTPHEYLMRVAPLQGAEHTLRAQMPDRRTRRVLKMQPREPCLLVIRRTWSAGAVASAARLYYPGSRYEMSGRAQPGGSSHA